PAAPPARQTWAPDLTMIDRHYGHLARDGREHAIRLLDALADSHNGAPMDVRGRSADVADPLGPRTMTADWQAEQETSRSCSRPTTRRRGDATAQRRRAPGGRRGAYGASRVSLASRSPRSKASSIGRARRAIRGANRAIHPS